VKAVTGAERTTWAAVSSFVLASLALIGCTGEVSADSDSETVTIRDSAGIQIVEHPGPLPTHSRIELGPPMYRHGSRPDDYLFQEIYPGALRSDGSAVVADGRANEVVAISPDGSTATVLATEGQGPAEISRVRSIHVHAGDTTVVEDDGNAKFLEFVDSTFVRSVPILRQRFELAVHAVADDGTFLMATDSWRSDEGTGWIPGYMVRFNREDGAMDTVATYDVAPARPRGEAYNPFGPFGHLDATPHGFVYGRRDQPQFIWRDTKGRIEQIVRWVPEVDYPTQADFDSYLKEYRSLLARVNSGLPAEQIDKMVEEVEFPLDQALPLFGLLRGNTDGSLWLTEFDARTIIGADPQKYIELSPDGRHMRRIVFPEPVQVLDVANGLVLAVVTDELDVPSVAAFRLPTESSSRK
jgi:hypothetical protein